ncbi:MAG: RNA polymerase factor sigma-32 [Rickettsiales bacterium]|jgi:RNA polymerase sigma-32 factor|nr:RNA polymerase factor sigma-32 [Rickettsiales bacterium]
MKRQINRLSSNGLPVVSDDGNLARYIGQVQSFPMLSKEEEYEYAVRFASMRERGAAEALIKAHLRLVVSMAYGLRDYGISVADLISAGNLGLMHAVQKFAPEKGFRFSTYATFWIKAEMYDLILSNWSLVKIGSGAAEKKVFFNLTRAKRALGIMDGSLSVEQAKRIASDLDVSEDDVINMNVRMSARDLSLNASRYDDGEEQLDFIEDNKKPIMQELEEHEARVKNSELLRAHLMELSERERQILVARRLSDPVRTLDELSAEYGISRERVRQIEEKAFAKLQKAMVKQLADSS